MIRELLILSLLNSSVSLDYVKVDTIKHYQSMGIDKKIDFCFDSDYFKTHQLLVEIKLYNFKNEEAKRYHNNLQVIGKKEATANIEVMENIEYALIDVYYDESIVSKDIRINFYNQEDCYINKEERVCSLIYLSEFSNNMSIDHKTNVLVKKDVFDKYLAFNVLNLSNIDIVSEYEFDNAKISLIIKNKIEGFNLPYKDGYTFELELVNDSTLNFKLLENYYLNLKEFKYEEEYMENSIMVDQIIFPYSDDFIEYDCMIIIKDFVSVVIEFSVATQGDLVGECSTSKYCILRDIR